MMTEGWVEAIVGGAIVGASTGLLVVATERTRGVSGMVDAALFGPDRATSGAFLAGMIGVGAALHRVWPAAFGGAPPGRVEMLVFFGGLLVGLGARLANGCTSGHGILGLARTSRRSMVAMAIFVAFATLTVKVVPL